MTTAAIHQPQYLPYPGFFHKVMNADVFVAMDDVEFHRRGLQHRNKIKGSDGWQWLTVPVIHRWGQLLSDVTMDSTSHWQRKHANAIRWNYGRAPFFDDYSPAYLEILSRPWTNLLELNLALTERLMADLGITTSIVRSSSLHIESQRSQRLVDLCVAVGADTYLSGPGGRRYMELEPFDVAGVQVRWQEFESPRYQQLFPQAGFIPDLSILDALFCCGPGTRDLLKEATHVG